MLLTLLLSADAAPYITPYAGTDFPIMIGGGMGLETSDRIRADVSGGILPGPYWDAVNGALVAFDVYSELTAELIDVLLNGALVLRTEGGWRPWADRGVFFTLGYQHIALAGDTTDLRLFGDGIDSDLLDRAAEDSTLDVRVRPHMLLGRVGVEHTIRESIELRLTLGFAYTVASSSTVESIREAATPAGAAIQEEVSTAAEAYLNDVFTSWVHVPMIGVSGGYRF